MSLPAYDGARLAQVSLFSLAATYLVAQAWSNHVSRRVSWNIREPLSFVLLFLAFLSWWVAGYSSRSLQDLTLHLGMVALALAIASLESSHTHRWLDRALALSPVWLAVLTLAIYLTALSTGQPLNARQLHLGFENPRFLNHAQSIFVPWLAIVFLEREPRKSLQRLALLAAGFHVALAYLDVSRGTGLAWLGVLVVLFLAGARIQARRFATVLLGGVLFGMLAFDLLPNLLSRHWEAPFARANEIGSAHSRDLLWAQSLAMIEAAPWLGQGPMAFAALVSARGAHPHNVYLQWAAEYGPLAACIATILLLTPIVRALKSRASDALTIGLAATCVACLIDGCVSGNFVMPMSQIWIACVYGQLLARVTPSSMQLERAFAGRMIYAVLLASQVWLLAMTAYQCALPDRSDDAPSSTSRKPRFWLDGQV
jgi:O-antigen ligase